MNFESLRGARVAVLGLGMEGRCAVASLSGRLGSGELVALANGKPHQELAGVRVVPGPVSAKMLGEFDLVVKSPGFSPYRDPVAGALARGVRFTSVSRLWFEMHPQATTVCITGSKGKSTTAALLTHVLKEAGIDCALGGNIGVPLLDLPPAEVYVLELSSYQCTDLSLRPPSAALLNLFPEHLDWHGDVQRYYTDKLNLFCAHGAGTVILPAQVSDPYAAALIQQAARQAEAVHWLQGGACGELEIRARTLWLGGNAIADLEDFPLHGRHNGQNLLVALTLAKMLGLAAQDAARHLASFQPLPHRCQVLGTRAGIRYVDDSIATTPHASIAALEGLGNDPDTVILVGGYDRGVSWEVFAAHTRKHPPRAVITMPQNGSRIGELMQRKAPRVTVEHQADLESAVARAQGLLDKRGTILLSPGAPSYSSYRDFADRGRHFAALAGLLE